MTLIRTSYAETIEGTVRKQRALPASFIMRMGDKRLPKLVVLGELEVGQRVVGTQANDWVRGNEDLVALNMGDEKEGGSGRPALRTWTSGTTTSRGEWGWLMRKWHQAQLEASEKRQAVRAGEGRRPAPKQQ